MTRVCKAAVLELLPVLRAHACAADRRQNALDDSRGIRRAAWHGDIYRNDVGYPAATRAAFTKDPAGAAAVPQRYDQFRIGRGFIDSSQGCLHVRRDGTCHEEQIGVAGARHETNAEAFEIVVGIVERLDLELTAVAGAGIDVADAEGAAENGADALIERVAGAKQLVGFRRRLGEHTYLADLAQCFQHGSRCRRMRDDALTDPPRCRPG